jgi:hypothetical protein
VILEIDSDGRPTFAHVADYRCQRAIMAAKGCHYICDDVGRAGDQQATRCLRIAT